jgi:PKHD-type hydroxylase
MSLQYYNKVIPPFSFDYYYYWQIENVFSKKECELIINSEGEFIESKIDKKYQFNEIDKSRRSSKEKYLPPNEKNLWIYERLEKHIIDTNKKIFNFDITLIKELQVLEYCENDFFNLHHDIGSQQASTRKLSIIVFLSHPSEYEGGELKFIPSINISNKQGSMIIFPSYLMHEVTKVTWGKRYTLVAWVHGPRFR